MTQGREPTRRNRNIGTAKQGHGQNNDLVIPGSWHSPTVFWENLTHYKAIERLIHGKSITIIVEKTRTDSFHACTVDDFWFLLAHLPKEDVENFNLIILRQPKRKEALLSGVWGRAVFWAEIGDREGPAIFLEAQCFSKPLRWSKSLSPDRQQELEKLKQDGHDIVTDKRQHLITSTIASVRATQLYRTLLHEMGHHIDYRRTNSDKWDQKTSLDKEIFAHQHADKRRQELIERGVIPFYRILDLGSLRSEGLALEDFWPVGSQN
jgi:hypothetical protein